MNNKNTQSSIPIWRKIMLYLGILFFALSIAIRIWPTLLVTIITSLHLTDLLGDCNFDMCGMILLYWAAIFAIIGLALLITILFLLYLVPGKPKKIGWIFLALGIGLVSLIVGDVASQIQTKYEQKRIEQARQEARQSINDVIKIDNKKLAQPLIFKNSMIITDYSKANKFDEMAKIYYQWQHDKNYHTLKYEKINAFTGQDLTFSYDKKWIAGQNMGVEPGPNGQSKPPIPEIQVYEVGTPNYWNIALNGGAGNVREYDVRLVAFSADSKKFLFEIMAEFCVNGRPCPDIPEGQSYEEGTFRELISYGIFDTTSGAFTYDNMDQNDKWKQYWPNTNCRLNDIDLKTYNPQTQKCQNYDEAISKYRKLNEYIAGGFDYKGEYYYGGGDFEIKSNLVDKKGEWVYAVLNRNFHGSDAIVESPYDEETDQFLFKINLQTKEKKIIVNPKVAGINKGKYGQFGKVEQLDSGDLIFTYNTLSSNDEESRITQSILYIYNNKNGVKKVGAKEIDYEEYNHQIVVAEF